jgi:hypothetical protein
MTQTEELELYDPLASKSTLSLYLVKEQEKWIPIESKELVIGKQLTRLLQLSHDSRPLLKAIRPRIKLEKAVVNKRQPASIRPDCCQKRKKSPQSLEETADKQKIKNFKFIIVYFCHYRRFCTFAHQR